ncbi:DUF5722 domain-containing protein [Paenibacillus sp. CF384]|uniref:DUF5722 domain-containing protein n=1 Tax=Paenibacillus sp. CF384 TaxID=1884382 RepID=UPI00089C9DD8|nr:DUF5722 domain-containing protein [Paenibacillus sp. CF384]SDX38709.1 hypothetical protein SAMN05518855_101351 [Paenibacillus sp. CF384]
MKSVKRWMIWMTCLAVLIPFIPGPKTAEAAVLQTDVGSFESGTDGWQWGSNVTGLSNVTSSLNGPQTPYGGNRMGELTTSSAAGTAWRSTYKNFSPALNVSATPYFHGAFNTYGINQSHTQFEVRITFTSGTQTLVSTQAISGDSWNELSVDLSDWAYRTSISKIEVAFRSVTYSSAWTGKHQLDNIGFSAYPAAYPGSISSVSASSTQITAAGTYNTATSVQLDLIELQTYEQYNINTTYTADATQTVTPSGGVASFSLSTARYASSRDKAYSKFVVINHTTKKLVASPTYVTQQTASVNTFAFPTASSIKGLQVQTVDDAQKLGISHAALNVSYNELFLDNATGAIPFVMDGTTYYFKQSYINGLDHDIKTLSDDDVIVSLILIMYNAAGTINSKLVYPDYAGGTVAAINTTNADGVRYWKAGTEFLASRYTRSDELYGRAVNYIVGNEVNSQAYWYDMGNKQLQDFVEQYARAYRIAETAVKKYYSNARTYISLDHFWNGSVGSDALRTYKGKGIMDEFNKRITAEGNIPWNIAYHPYPEDLFDPTIWNDTSVTNSSDSVRINFKNLQVLTNYIGAANYLYGGNKRRIILSEQGFHSLSNSLADQKTQAAAYAYSYYKAKFLGGIDSFILHRHVDHGGEGGLNLGLWARDTAKSVLYAPKDQKYIYNVFQKIDTSDSAAVTDFAKAIIGISDWASVIPGYNASLLADRTPPAVGTLSSVGSITPTANVSTFETSADGWAISEYSQSAATVSSFANSPGTPFSGSKAFEININNATTGDGEGGARAEKGITKVFSSPINVTSTPKFQFALDSYGACPGATQYNVTVRIYSGGNIIEGKATMTPDTWNKYSMDLSGWAYKGSIDKIKIWYSANSTSIWNAYYQVDQIGFSS